MLLENNSHQQRKGQTPVRGSNAQKFNGSEYIPVGGFQRR